VAAQPDFARLVTRALRKLTSVRPIRSGYAVPMNLRVVELLAGLREGAGLATPPLSPAGSGRLRDLLAGAGRRP
jgi:hypothetical protein